MKKLEKKEIIKEFQLVMTKLNTRGWNIPYGTLVDEVEKYCNNYEKFLPGEEEIKKIILNSDLGKDRCGKTSTMIDLLTKAIHKRINT